ncbi:MAG: hypothetical protein KFB96_06660 [Thiocapsa sp.]|uniref:hypothetical protein n=1 Tax=Thiocapsa sp. TaxID=2024551 RepID=UPI001BCA82D3|nr:hypothetical protein [Thiocapsa sp.]QVL50141.1 MAG: hypothetical protein KFB96_06660 [Thiocapsa sp.]
MLADATARFRPSAYARERRGCALDFLSGARAHPNRRCRTVGLKPDPQRSDALDQELQQVVRDAQSARRHADKRAKVITGNASTDM